MRNLFDGDCSPAEEQAAGRWLAEHAETKEADELLYALLRETKPATADAEGAFRRVCRRLGIAPKSSAWRLVGRWTMRAAACLLLPVAALAFYLYGEAQRPGEWFEAYAPLRQDAARGAARRLGGGHQFGIEADLSRPLRARSPAGLSGGRGATPRLRRIPGAPS